MKRQINLEGAVLRFWEHRPRLGKPGVEDVDRDDFPVLDIDLEAPIWELFKTNPPRTIDGSILPGKCGAPGYTREACWQPVLDDLCVSCTYHYENDPDNKVGGQEVFALDKKERDKVYTMRRQEPGAFIWKREKIIDD